MTKILVAEDQVDLREMIALTLRLSGYEVLATEDGEQAYRQAKAALPDLMILDLEMPLLSGSEVCRRLKARLLEVPAAESGTLGDPADAS